MCIIIAKDEGFTLTEDVINNSWNRNADGAGFMYAKEGKLFVEKGFMKLSDFKAAYEKVGHLPAVLHFRIKTHGKVDEVNTHPFQVHGSLAFAHNGIISNIDTPDKDKSDTWHFNEHLIKPMCASDFKFLEKDWNKQLISGYIGASKLAFLDNTGTITLINEDKGLWDDGVWFSNSSYKPPQPVVQQGSYRRPSTPGWYSGYPQQSSFLDVGDFITVTKAKNPKVKVGDVGMIDKIYGSGYLSCIFHKWKQGVAIETTAMIHEDDVAYRWSY